MSDNLRATWRDIAHHWDDWGPPLRPSAEDLRITRGILSGWHEANPVEKVKVFLCGVTPEIATMDWPFPIDLTGMDHVESMVRLVWPGDVSGVRRALVGNWLQSGLPPSSQHVVIGDGGFGFFGCPSGQRELARALRDLMVPGGLFLYRHYAQVEPREPLGSVMEDLHRGRIGNFHIFKWRVAMALQTDSETGVVLDDVYRACTADYAMAAPSVASPDRRERECALQSGVKWRSTGAGAAGEPPGWSRREVETIRFYEGQQSRLFFPTLDEFNLVLEEFFDDIQVRYPEYELGDRCPIISARPR